MGKVRDYTDTGIILFQGLSGLDIVHSFLRGIQSRITQIPNE